MTERPGPNDVELRAPVDLYRGGSLVAHLSPGKNNYQAERQISNEMAIYHDWKSAGDVDVVADQINSDGSIEFKVFVKPLVNLIWLAGLVFLGGGLIALWPDAREERRLVARYREVGAFAEAG